jgi:hypothetical protein
MSKLIGIIFNILIIIIMITLEQLVNRFAEIIDRVILYCNINRHQGCKMFKFYSILFLAILLSSCATILNNPRNDVSIFTDSPATVEQNGEKIPTNSNEVNIYPKRQQKDLRLIVSNDSISKTITIPSRYSAAYYLNIITNYGIGMLFESDSDISYTYPGEIFINTSDTNDYYQTFNPWSKKGNLYLHLSFPYINSFILKPNGEPDAKINTGFMGVSAGLDYFHSDYQFLGINFSAVTDFIIPLPAPIDPAGEYEAMASLYFSLTNNHAIKHFKIGYGISLSKNIWNLSIHPTYEDEFEEPFTTREPKYTATYALGFAFPFYYQITENFFVGLIYRPSFFRFTEENRFEYEHQVSFDFGWKIGIIE